MAENILIVDDSRFLRQVVARMAQRLAPGGLFVLGSTESLPGPGLPLAEVPGARGIYRKA